VQEKIPTKPNIPPQKNSPIEDIDHEPREEPILSKMSKAKKSKTTADTKKPEKKNSSISEENCNCKPVIIIDPGHGDIFNKYLDPGAVYKKKGKVLYTEKDLALKVSKLLEQELKKIAGYTVFLTRTKDLDDKKRVRIKWRTDIFSAKKGDIFISMHLNSSINISSKGFSILTQKGSHNKYSKSLARSIVSNYTQLSSRGVKSERNLGVLRRVEAIDSKKAAILIELGFISNTNDRNKIINNASIIAQQITEGIKAYVSNNSKIYKN
jgi:N-acetylmuramoyl-L-alanine amidase